MQANILKDKHGRQLNYLRVSITDRCNLNCLYCRRWKDAKYFPPSEILSYEEIIRLINIGTGLGITKVRITGGEPFVRKGALSFMCRVPEICGARDVSLTTNGVLLKDNLEKLKQSGIKRLNISLDSLKREKYRLITGQDGFFETWDSIMAALEAGFDPVKVNVVVMRGINDDEIERFAGLTRDFPLHVRFIEYMPSCSHPFDRHRQMFMPEIKALSEAEEKLDPVWKKDSSQVAERFRYRDAPGEIGFISSLSTPFCKSCNRLRLTADGKLRPCLMSDRYVDIKQPLRKGLADSEIADHLKLAALKKPARPAGKNNHALEIPDLMSAIGG